MKTEQRYFTTSDGVRLHYRVSGNGPAIVMLPGWLLDTTAFERNYPAFQKEYTVYTLDFRNHGLSQEVSHGLRITRLSQDLHELLEHEKIEKTILLGHSMGNSVIWGYFTLYGQARVSKYVLEDQAPCLIGDPAWTEEENIIYTGTPHPRQSHWELIDAMDRSWEECFEVFKKYFAPYREGKIIKRPPFEPDPLDPPKKNYAELNNRYHARLMTDHMTNDWRDIIAKIEVPTLLFAGGASQNGNPKMWEWMKSRIKNSEVYICPAEEGGTHGTHKTNPEMFNRVVLDFLRK